MALQSSGTIKMSEINTELGRSSTATISLDSAESGTYATINTASASYPNDARPASISEWYSYDHSAASGFSGNISDRSESSTNEACEGLDVETAVYKNGTSSTPVAGEALFTNSGLSTNLVPGQGFGAWYKYEDVPGGNVPYAVYLLENEGTNECIIESVSAC